MQRGRGVSEGEVLLQPPPGSSEAEAEACICLVCKPIFNHVFYIANKCNIIAAH